MRSETFLYEIRFPTTFILSFFLMGCVFLASVFYAHIGTYINTGYVDCNDVTICCPLRIGPTCVPNHLGCLLQ